MREGNGDPLTEILARVEQNLNGLVQGLGLLGVKRCSRCERFFRSSDPGALFSVGPELVCFSCIPAWWPSRRDQLSCEDRQKTETDLVFWLRNFHHAQLVKGVRAATENQPAKFELVAGCLDCRGTGTLMGGNRCRYCDGPGSVRVVVPENAR